MIDQAPFACPECGVGTVSRRPIGHGRTWTKFGMEFDLPPDREAMACDACGEMYTDPDDEAALDALCKQMLADDIAASAEEYRSEAALWDCTIRDGWSDE